MKLSSIFKSQMVFAVDKPIRIWGEGKGNIEVSFAFYTKQIETVGGKWFVEFPPMGYGGPYELIVVSENERVKIEDIYIGDVYLFAGQSNMQFKLYESSAPQSVYRTNEKLRMFVRDRLEIGEFYTPDDGWIKSKKDDVGKWSAIAYLSGSEIARRKHRAVGVITCYQGASVIESWVPKGTFEKMDINVPLEKSILIIRLIHIGFGMKMEKYMIKFYQRFFHLQLMQSYGIRERVIHLWKKADYMN